jgi:hypothetical protein
MRDNVAYQVILEEGRIEQARETLLNLGTRLLRAPSKVVRQKIESMDDLEELKDLTDRVLDVKSWKELLKNPNR